MRARLFLCAAAILCGCSRTPKSYAPPAQFVMPSGPDPVTEVRLVTTNHPDAPFSIIDGVLDAGYGWGFKWTLDRAHFQFIAGDLTNNDLLLRYGMDPRTLHDRGPVTITIAINGKTFDIFTEGVEGVHEHRRPADAIKSKDIETLNLSLTVDPPWISPDGKKLGLYLGAIGFVPRT
jgi:hypothetical protein